MRLSLNSLFFTIDGKIFQVTSTDGYPGGHVADHLINLETRERFVVKRAYILSKPVKWLSREDVAHLNPIGM